MKKKDKNTILLPAFERMHHVIVTEFTVAVNLATDLRNGHPLLVNFANLPVDDANSLLSFLSGVVFALDGQVREVAEKTYLFGSETDFLDGSLNNYLKERSAK